MPKKRPAEYRQKPFVQFLTNAKHRRRKRRAMTRPELQHLASPLPIRWPLNRRRRSCQRGSPRRTVHRATSNQFLQRQFHLAPPFRQPKGRSAVLLPPWFMAPAVPRTDERRWARRVVYHQLPLKRLRKRPCLLPRTCREAGLIRRLGRSD